jgi:hypothetical protein
MRRGAQAVQRAQLFWADTKVSAHMLNLLRLAARRGPEQDQRKR